MKMTVSGSARMASGKARVQQDEQAIEVLPREGIAGQRITGRGPQRDGEGHADAGGDHAVQCGVAYPLDRQEKLEGANEVSTGRMLFGHLKTPARPPKAPSVMR